MDWKDTLMLTVPCRSGCHIWLCIHRQRRICLLKLAQAKIVSLDLQFYWRNLFPSHETHENSLRPICENQSAIAITTMGIITPARSPSTYAIILSTLSSIWFSQTPWLARFLTSSGSIPNKGGARLKWLPSANLHAAICKKIIPSEDNLVDRSNSSPTRRHVWISPAEREPLWFFLISSCNACKPKVHDFEMAARLLDHSVCKHQHTLQDVTQLWHREDIIDELVSKASGQIIYAFHCAQVYDDQNGCPEELRDTVVEIYTLSCNHQQAFSPIS